MGSDPGDGGTASMADWRAEIDGYIGSIAGELVATRRHLHAHPEPSREEYRTAEFLAGGLGACVALHVDPGLPVGRLAQRVGVMTAFCQDLRVSVRGVGGHSARPHQAADPIAAAVQFVSAVYQLIPCSVDAREAAVVTFG